MSVFAKTKSEVFKKGVDMGILNESLKELNLSLNESIKEVRNSYGHAKVDMAILNNGEVTSLGFVRTANGGLILEGDPFKCNIKDRFGNKISDGGHQKILDAIAQIYQKNLTVRTLMLNGWSTTVSNKNKDIIINCIK